MSIHAQNWVWQESQARGNDRLLLLCIADKADDNGRDAFPGLNFLVDKTLLSKRTVQYSIARLQEIRELEVKVNGGPGYRLDRRTNLYTVLLTCCGGKHGVQNLHVVENGRSEVVDISDGVQDGVQESANGVQLFARNTPSNPPLYKGNFKKLKDELWNRSVDD